MKIEINKNLAMVFKVLEEQGMKTTQIAREIGFTTTSQLHNTIEGNSLLSTKATIGLITNLNVNPYYLFLGEGEMFLSDEIETEKMKRENLELKKEISGLKETIKKMEKTNLDLIEISSAAIKYYKTKSEPSKIEEDEKVGNSSPLIKFLESKEKGRKKNSDIEFDDSIIKEVSDSFENNDSQKDEKVENPVKKIKTKK